MRSRGDCWLLSGATGMRGGFGDAEEARRRAGVDQDALSRQFTAIAPVSVLVSRRTVRDSSAAADASTRDGETL